MSRWKRIVEKAVTELQHRVNTLHIKQDMDSYRTTSLEHGEIGLDHRLRQVERITARPSAATRLRNARRRRPPRM